MSEVYVGVDGHSCNASFTIPDDGDDVNAASVDPAFQQTADNWAHAKAAYPDLYTGGDYRAQGIAELILSNTLALYGSTLFAGASYVINGQTLNIGFGGLGNGAIEVHSGSELQIDAGGVGLQLGTWTTSGNAAWTIKRVTTLTTTATGFHPEYFDVVLITGGSFNIQLADPNTSNSGGTPLPVGICCTFSLVGAPIGGQSTTTFTDHSSASVGGLVPTGGANFTGAFLTLMTVNVSGTIVWANLGIAVGV